MSLFSYYRVLEVVLQASVLSRDCALKVPVMAVRPVPQTSILSRDCALKVPEVAVRPESPLSGPT